MRPREGDAFFSSAMTAGAGLGGVAETGLKAAWTMGCGLAFQLRNVCGRLAPGHFEERMGEDLLELCRHAVTEPIGAEEGTRTPTPLRVRGPEPRASANSATSALIASPSLAAETAVVR